MFKSLGSSKGPGSQQIFPEKNTLSAQLQHTLSVELSYLYVICLTPVLHFSKDTSSHASQCPKVQCEGPEDPIKSYPKTALS